MNGKRSRLIIIAATGAVTVATAVSVAAVTLPSGSAASSASTADAQFPALSARSAKAAHGETMSLARQLFAFDQMRYGLAERRAQRTLAREAAAKAAAAKAAAAKAAAAKAAAARVAAQQRAAQQQQPAQQQPAPPPAASTPSGSPEQVAEQMLSQFGWPSSQFACLQPLWARESGWNVYASNPSSGAYGIPQALPGSKMASAGPNWQSDAATQIRWGLEYIQGSYGSPCGAWAHEQADGWY